MRTYVALGDSITAGVGACSKATAYPSVVSKLLCEQSSKTAVDTFAHTGWTSTDLRRALSVHDYIPVRRSTVTSIWIGGDNLVAAGLLALRGAGLKAFPKSLSQYENDLTAILKTIRRISNTSIVLCTQYNPFPNTPAVAPVIQSLNGITRRAASQYRTEMAPIDQWFEGKQAALLAGYRTGRLEDGTAGSFPIHPNDKGHLLIARGLLPLIIS